MRVVTIKNITLQFDSVEDNIDDEYIQGAIDVINITLSEYLSNSQPQILVDDDSTIKVIELENK